MNTLERAIRQSLEHVFVTSFDETPPVRCITAASQPTQGCQSAYMVVSGTAHGVIALWTECVTAAELVRSLLGISPGSSWDTTMVPDGLCELLNMIAGGAKARLVGTPWHFLLSCPLTTEPMEVDDSRNHVLALEAETSVGIVRIRVSIAPAGDL